MVEYTNGYEALARAKVEVAKYRAGQEVTVYYDPRRPSFATLRVGDPTGGKLPLGVIIFGSVAATAGIVWLLIVSKWI